MKSKTRIQQIPKAIFSLLIVGLILSGGLAQAQNAREAEGAEVHLIKPERVDESCPMPAFPESLEQNSEARGAVIIFVTLDSSGYVIATDIKIERPEGFGFGEAVSEAIAGWEYKPAYWGGKPVEYSITETFYFENGTVRLKEKKETGKALPKPQVKVE